VKGACATPKEKEREKEAMQAQPMPLCSVCPSVTFVYFVETNKHIFKIFSWVAT